MMLRSFIAIEIPTEIQNALALSTTSLRRDLPNPLIRWVVPQNVHLTLKFLGNVSPENLERLSDGLSLEALDHKRFTISVGGLGVFPSPNQARILWIGLGSQVELLALVKGVEGVAARLGFPAEERPFSPHLTIGRVGKNITGKDLQRIRSVLEGAAVGILGDLIVDALHIFKSDLKPDKPVYTRLYTLPLKST